MERAAESADLRWSVFPDDALWLRCACFIHGGDSSGGKAAGAETSRLDPVCGLINYHWLYRSLGTVLQTDGL